jgi:hypothetical protein
MKCQPIQIANCEDAIRHIKEAKKRNDVEKLKIAQDELSVTLAAIKNIDQATYEKYSVYLHSTDTL